MRNVFVLVNSVFYAPLDIFGTKMTYPWVQLLLKAELEIEAYSKLCRYETRNLSCIFPLFRLSDGQNSAVPDMSKSVKKEGHDAQGQQNRKQGTIHSLIPIVHLVCE